MGFFWCILIGCVLYIPTPMRTETCEAEDEFGMTYYHYCSDVCCDYTSPPDCCESVDSTAYKNDNVLRPKRSIHQVKTPRYNRYGPGYYTTYRWEYRVEYKKTLSSGAITGIVFGTLIGFGLLCGLVIYLCYSVLECKNNPCDECTFPCKSGLHIEKGADCNCSCSYTSKVTPSG